ncbi:hypothetical protein KI387_035984, partial [Taxus chinensis]
VADGSEVGRKIFELHRKAREDAFTSRPTSFKDILGTRGGSTPGNHAYLVDLVEEIPALEIKNPEVEEYYHCLTRDVVIEHFNGRWPSSTELYQWVFENWYNKCEISFCSKGFFIVHFRETEDYQCCLSEGPWLGKCWLVFDSLVYGIDSNSHSITKTHVWVRLPNLPFHL